MSEDVKQNDSDESDDGLSTGDDFVQIYMISIDIIGAYDLEKADTFGKSDPYCKVSGFSTSYTTCTIKKTLNPKWNEHLEMTFFNDPKAIKFEIFDWDGKLGGKDDDIGVCQFNLEPNFYADTSGGFTGKIKLENCKSGELELKIIARKLLPLELEKNLTRLQDMEQQNTNTLATQDNEIQDLNNKNAALETEINTLETDIDALKNEQIPNAQNEEIKEKQTGETLDEENKAMSAEVETLEEKYVEIEKEENEVNKELEDIKISEDKKNTECEHLRADMASLEQQIENKKKEENERKEREAADVAAEKEKLKKDDEEKENEYEKNKKEKEKLDVQIMDAASKSDPHTPLVQKDTETKMGDKEDEDNGCCCIVM